VSIVVTSKVGGGYLDFLLVDEEDHLLGASSDRQMLDGDTGTLDKTVTRTGTYYVRVTGSSGATGAYDIAAYSAWFNPDVTDSQRSFYGTRYTARYVANGNYPLPTLIYDGNRPSLHRFTVQQGVPVNVAITSHASAGYLDFQILDASGNSAGLSSDRQMYNGDIGTLSRTFAPSGVYFVQITSTAGAVGSYDLTISGQDADRDSDSDGLNDAVEYWRGTNPNHVDSDGDGMSDYNELLAGRNPRLVAEPDATVAISAATALAIPYYDKPFLVQRPNSSTWYKVNLTAGQGITVVLNATTQSGYLDMVLYDVNGTTAKVSSDDRQMTSGQAGVMNFKAAAAGTYYIMVSGSSDAAGAYELAVYNAHFNPGVTDSQRDFFSSDFTAYQMVNGFYIMPPLNTMPPLHLVTPMNVHRVYLFAGQNINLSVMSKTQGEYIDFHLWDDAGNIMGVSSDRQMYDGDTANLVKSIVKDGWYFIHVTGNAYVSGGYDITSSISITPPQFKLFVAKAGSGTGEISASGLTCIGNSCEGIYNTGSQVTLTVSPASWSSFDGWFGGGCSGTGNCIVTIDSAKSVTALFSKTDFTPPTASISFNNGAAYTKVQNVRIDISCTDSNNRCVKMQFSPDNIDWSQPIVSFVPTKAWSLTTGDGEKFAYAKFMDEAGNWTNTVTAKVILDTVVPSISIQDIPPPVCGANSLQVNGSVSDNYGVASLKINNITVQPLSDGSFSYNLPLVTGLKTATFDVIDLAGNSIRELRSFVYNGQKAGDCNCDGKVTIDEVQSAINMYLGLKTPAVCVDLNGDGVSIDEVQKVINGYLGL
jgi:hypothetical protein